jgi:hypothetical protein
MRMWICLACKVCTDNSTVATKKSIEAARERQIKAQHYEREGPCIRAVELRLGGARLGCQQSRTKAIWQERTSVDGAGA